MVFGSWEAAEFRLSDLLSGAGATTGVLIAGTILLNFLSSKAARSNMEVQVLAVVGRAAGLSG